MNLDAFWAKFYGILMKSYRNDSFWAKFYMKFMESYIFSINRLGIKEMCAVFVLFVLFVLGSEERIGERTVTVLHTQFQRAQLFPERKKQTPTG